MTGHTQPSGIRSSFIEICGGGDAALPVLPGGCNPGGGPADKAYPLFRCRPCRRTFNERTGTPFNHLQVPTDIGPLVVLWRLRSTLSLRDQTVMCLTRGFTFTHETVREWEARFAPLLAERLRTRRRGKAGRKWHADETYVKVAGHWCSRYRAIDTLDPLGRVIQLSQQPE
jgi:hypothetical protein